MAKKARSEEQILRASHQAERQADSGYLPRARGQPSDLLRVWKKKYSGLALNELRELRQLRAENGKLKRLVADFVTGPPHAAGDRKKKAVKPRQRRELGSGSRRSLRPVHADSGADDDQSGDHASSKPRDPQIALRMRLRALAASRVRFGCR